MPQLAEIRASSIAFATCAASFGACRAYLIVTVIEFAECPSQRPTSGSGTPARTRLTAH
jgi:hypothetical protein